jgi:Trp operon repressor
MMMKTREHSEAAQQSPPLLKLVAATRLTAEKQLSLSPSETLRRVVTKLHIVESLLAELQAQEQLASQVAQEVATVGAGAS